jgi:hypothetical protein
MALKDLVGNEFGYNCEEKVGKSGNSSKTEPSNKGEVRKKPVPAYKYSNKGKGELYEAVIIDGKPYFLTYNRNHKKIKFAEHIEENGRVIEPPEKEEYPYEAYEFTDEKEIENYFKEALDENLDTLFNKIESIVSEYNDQEEHILTTIAADIVFSYFQDRFSTTHYDILVGLPGSGKSSLGDTYGAIGYRPVNMTDPTAANLYRLLGPVEPGQCTIILEEAERIDLSQDIMGVLKTGYTINGRVARINMNTGKQEFFYSHCLKIIISERSPNQNIAKGVLDRSFIHNCYKGNPRYDIKEILNPTETGGPAHQNLLEELNRLRKTLFMYRLIHFKDPIPDLDIGIIGRDKELSKPILQLFHNTKAQLKVKDTLQKIIDSKNQRKGTIFESMLLAIIASLITSEGHLISFRRFWDYLKLNIPGKQDENRPNEYHTESYGTLYSTTITNIMQDKFGVMTKHARNGNVLVFNVEIISKLAKQYNHKIVIALNANGSEGGEHGEGVWKKRYGDTSESEHEKQDINDLKEEKTIPKGDDLLSLSPSPPSPLDTIYRKYPRSDVWACHNCNMSSDIWFMKKHPCRNDRKDRLKA